MTSKIQGPNRDTVEYFNGAAEGYDSRYHGDTPGSLAFRIRKQRVLELFDKAGGAVLDVGCGTGVIVDELLARGCRFTGVDPAVKMIEMAKTLHGSRQNVDFTVGCAERIEYADEAFDAVICMGVLERVGDTETALSEMIRVLKPGGTLLITTPNLWSPYLLWRDYVYYPAVAVLRGLIYPTLRKSRPLTIPGHRLLSAGRFARDLARHGAHVTDIVYTGFNPMVPPLEVMGPGLAVRAMRMLEPMGKTGLRFLGAAIVVKSRKR